MLIKANVINCLLFFYLQFNYTCEFYDSIQNYTFNKLSESNMQTFAKEPMHNELSISQIRIIVSQLFKNTQLHDNSTFSNNHTDNILTFHVCQIFIQLLYINYKIK